METMTRTRRGARPLGSRSIHPNEERTLRALDDCKNNRNLVELDCSSFEAFQASIMAL